MVVTGLTRDQLVELKQAYLCETQERTSWGEIAAADETVSDETVFDYYSGIDFVEDDFFCTAGAAIW